MKAKPKQKRNVTFSNKSVDGTRFSVLEYKANILKITTGYFAMVTRLRYDTIMDHRIQRIEGKGRSHRSILKKAFRKGKILWAIQDGILL